MVAAVVSAKNNATATTALSGILTAVDTVRNVVIYPALKAIVDTFEGVRHMQNSMEASQYPIIFHVLPMWHSLKVELSMLANGLSQAASNFLSKQFAAKLHGKISSMEIHGLFVASCLLHTGMHSFEKITEIASERVAYREKGSAFVRTLLNLLPEMSVSESVPGESNDAILHGPAPGNEDGSVAVPAPAKLGHAHIANA